MDIDDLCSSPSDDRQWGQHDSDRLTSSSWYQQHYSVKAWCPQSVSELTYSQWVATSAAAAQRGGAAHSCWSRGLCINIVSHFLLALMSGCHIKQIWNYGGSIIQRLLSWRPDAAFLLSARLCLNKHCVDAKVPSVNTRMYTYMYSFYQHVTEGMMRWSSFCEIWPIKLNKVTCLLVTFYYQSFYY